MHPTLFIDTSAWIAFVLFKEPRHADVTRVFRDALVSGAVVVTSNDVFDETMTRLVTGVGLSKTRVFYQLFQKNVREHALRQLWVDDVIQQEGYRVLEKYADHPLSFTDARSIALMKHYAIPKILTLDADFAKVGLAVLP